MPGAKPLSIDLHRLARFVKIATPATMVPALPAERHLSFYFHFLAVACLFLTIANLFHRRVLNRHAVLRNFGLPCVNLQQPQQACPN